ncbi:MAG: hypothetical protein GY795_11700 [Desulfobacterales bacterium]|nr:hypothetical protein [Desulfobacterales bacterium]
MKRLPIFLFFIILFTSLPVPAEKPIPGKTTHWRSTAPDNRNTENYA